MTEPFTHLEQKAYQSWWSNGLLDVIAGIAITGIGLSWLLDLAVFGAHVLVRFLTAHPVDTEASE